MRGACLESLEAWGGRRPPAPLFSFKETNHETQNGTLLILSALALGGCATPDFVRETVAPVQTQVQGLQQRVQANDEGLKSLSSRVKLGEDRVHALQQEAQARAAAAGKVREPGFMLSTLLTDDKIKFAHGRAQLSAEAGTELDQLLAKLKSDNQRYSSRSRAIPMPAAARR